MVQYSKLEPFNLFTGGPALTIRLVLADDHPLILEGLQRVLEAETDCEIVARCANGREALEAVRRHTPDILILDSRMPVLDGPAVLRELVQERSPTRVILLAEAKDEEILQEAIHLGARGFLLKEMPLSSLPSCIRRVHAGERWLERRSASQALEKLLGRAAGARAIEKLLTRREFEILRLLCQGLRNKEIAGALSIGEATVKVHLRHISEKLHVKGRMALLRYSEGRGLV